jgi:elongation factor 2
MTNGIYFDGQNEKGEKQERLINLIDLPRYSENRLETSTALRLADGAVIILDCVEGGDIARLAGAEKALHQALDERVKPVVAITKLDRLFLELVMKPEEIYQTLYRMIASLNARISTYADEELGDLSVSAEKGTVAFTSGRQGWGFTLKQFAELYAQKFGINEQKLVEKLWGDNYFDTLTKRWTTSPKSTTGARAFCQFIIDPIDRVISACITSNITLVDRIATTLGIQLSGDEKQLTGTQLLKAVMQKWLPADNLLDMMATHLPSPVEAQKYRTSLLFDDPAAEFIKKCDPSGPLLVFIYKVLSARDSSHKSFAVGRVFSGTIASGQKIRILGPNYADDRHEELCTGTNDHT